MEYTKPHKTIEQQIALLQARGLVVDDLPKLAHCLRHLNYYRLAGYWLPFEQDHASHTFKASARFDDVTKLYQFDRELRLIVLNMIEHIEVSVRTNWAYYFSQYCGAHAYLNENHNKYSNWHRKNIELLEEEIRRSSEVFIEHYKQTYTNPKHPPIWAVCEIMSLGTLSRWIKALNVTRVINDLSKTYGLDFEVLKSVLEHLSYVRNLCAHHNRLWNRNVTKTMQLPRSKPRTVIASFSSEEGKQRKIYNSLVMMLYLVKLISPENCFKETLVGLIEEYSIDYLAMGFPADWRQREIWN